MSLTLLALAIAPGLAISIYIYWKDKFEKEPKLLMIRAFLLGVLSIVPAVIIEKAWQYAGFGMEGSLLKTAFYAFIVVGFTEEWCKYAFLRRFLYPKDAFNEPYDGITYSVMISMGFATLENILYVAEGGLSVAVVRMVMAVPGHAVNAVVMGYFTGLAKFKGNRFGYLMLGLISATLLHGAYDFFLMQDEFPQLSLIGAIVALIIGIRYSRLAIKLHRENSPFK